MEDPNIQTDQIQVGGTEAENGGPRRMTQAQFDEMLDTLNSRSNLKKGILYGVIFGLVGAFLWAMIALLLNYNISLIAFLVGFLVSHGFVFAGRGTKQIAGVIAAIIALVSILIGDVSVVIMSVARYYNEPFMTTLAAIDWGKLSTFMIENSSFTDLLMYFFAVQIAYTRSFVRESKFNVVIVPDGHITVDPAAEIL